MSLQVTDHFWIDVVCVLVQALVGELLDQDIQLSFRDDADFVLVFVVVKLDHRAPPETPARAASLGAGTGPALESEKVDSEPARRQERGCPPRHPARSAARPARAREFPQRIKR